MTTTMNRFARGVAAAVVSFAGLSSSAAITYFHNDIVGSPLAATNESGQVIWRESYRPFGERRINSAAAAGNKVWFTSRLQDVDTGLVYMGARYYDPVVGRFISTDPAGFDERSVHSFNRYAYGNNNPYGYRDPNGRESLSMRIDNMASGCGPASCAGFAALKAAYFVGTLGFASVHDPMRDAYDSGHASSSEYARIGVAGGAAVALAGYAVGGVLGEAIASLGSVARGLGDLTASEAKAIQGVVNEAGRPLEVVGSAARGARTATSDIDYVAPPSSLKHFEGLESKLPGLDANHGIIPGYGNTNIGPVIRFEPK